MATARFIYDSPLKNSDLYYATKFVAHDPIAYFEFRNKKYLVVDDLEVDRAKKQANVHKVLLSTHYKKGMEIRKGNVVDIMDVIFKKLKIKTIEIPSNFPISLVREFEAKKYKLKVILAPFFPQREIKKSVEKQQILDSQKKTFKLIAVVEKTLRASKIVGNKIIFNRKTLTSELLKELVQLEAIRLGMETKNALIIACGEHSIDPHDEGSGPIKPHQPVIVDIFPSSNKTFYCGDATRTFCKGKASPELKKLFATVKNAQETAIKNIRADANARKIHEGVVKYFEESGYKTGEIGGRQQGFFHSTGHGIGLDVHEGPKAIGNIDLTLKVGNVTSVEPGLYYKVIGGVRIEDLVYVTKAGCEVLGYYPKRLEIT